MTQPCRSCGATEFASFCDLGIAPASNAFLRADQLSEPEPFFPLHARVCRSCFLVQLEQFHAPAEIFSDDYAYFSSFSDDWLAHAQAYVEEMRQRLGLGAHTLVIEIASNDGYLLQYFKAAGVPTLGIEPSLNVAEVVTLLDQLIAT